MTEIYLSAGHYPGRRGARYGRIFEFDIVAQVASATYGRLYAIDGPRVGLVPTGPISEKLAWINRRANPDDLAVELHLNHWDNYRGDRPPGPEDGPRGPECWIHRSAGERTVRAANAILTPLERFWSRSRGVAAVRRCDGHAFLRKTVCPSIIVQIDFVHAAAYCLAEIGPLSIALSRGLIAAAAID